LHGSPEDRRQARLIWKLTIDPRLIYALLLIYDVGLIYDPTYAGTVQDDKLMCRAWVIMVFKKELLIWWARKVFGTLGGKP